MCLFTAEEREVIRKEYYFEARAEESPESDVDGSVFTEHNLNTTENVEQSGLEHTKSLILAPFNTIERDTQQFLDAVLPLVVPKRTVKLSSQLRELDRRYERENNSRLDNGVYVQLASSQQNSVMADKGDETQKLSLNIKLGGSNNMSKRPVAQIAKSSTGTTAQSSYNSSQVPGKLCIDTA